MAWNPILPARFTCRSNRCFDLSPRCSSSGSSDRSIYLVVYYPLNLRLSPLYKEGFRKLGFGSFPLFLSKNGGVGPKKKKKKISYSILDGVSIRGERYIHR